MKARKLHESDSPTSSYVARSDESNDEENINEMESYISPRKTNTSKSEMGIIEEIYCENFMCHKRMLVKLGRNINFITGENGSGKSAIIAALQICLGASARTTHRGKSLKSLIRNNDKNDQPRSALVRITLLNDGKGSDAFRPETFGKRIQVERLIRAEGTAEYRLKDQDGKIISKSKADLESLLDHLNIQIENPCAVLDQENAKLFLKGDPMDKYKFFLQSTDLYKMRNVFAKIDDDTRVRQESTIQHEERKVKLLENAYEEARDMFEKAKSFAHLEDELIHIKHCLAWSFVDLKEKEFKEISTEYEELTIHVETYSKKAIVYQERVDILSQEQQEINNLLENERNKLFLIEKKKNEIKNKQKILRYPIQTKYAEKKQMERNINQNKLRLQQIENEKIKKKDEYIRYINTLENNQYNSANKIKLIKEQLEQTQNEKFKLEKEEFIDYDINIDHLNENLNECEQQIKKITTEINEKEQRLRHIQSKTTDRISLFGDDIIRLDQIIRQNLSRFRHPPIGPLGLHVHLPDEYQNYAVAIEVVLKNYMTSYLVGSGHDKALLDRFKSEVGCQRVGIIISKPNHAKYDRLNSPPGSLADHTLASILRIDNSNVFNVLVDVAKIESKLVFPSRQDAESRAIEQNGSRFSFPPHVSEIYIPNGDKMTIKSNNMAYIPNKIIKYGRYFTIDHTEEKKELINHLNQLKNKNQLLKKNKEIMIQDGNNMDKKRKEQIYIRENINRKIYNLQQEYNTLRNQQEEAMDTSIGDTTMLDDEKNEIEYEIEKFQEKLQGLEEELKNSNPEIEKMDENLNEIIKEQEIIEINIEKIKEKTIKKYQNFMEITKKSTKINQNLIELKKKLNEKNLIYHEKKNEINKNIEKATNICIRLNIEYQTPTYYNLQIKELIKRMNIEKSKFDHMDIIELELQQEEKLKKLKKKKFEFQKFYQNVQIITKMLNERKLKWEELRREIAHRTSMGFNKYMQKRNFAGKLKFHHDTQRLDISVVANDGHKTKLSIVNDMKQLSGGERSYTQVALLMALGECIECPFRVMDEFDVFMDSINRTQTLKLLIDTAKEEPSKQFIFVTPNDLSSVKEDSMVKIQKLLPPRDRLGIELS